MGNSEEFNEDMILWMRTRVHLLEYRSDSLWADRNSYLCSEFLKGEQHGLLAFMVDEFKPKFETASDSSINLLASNTKSRRRLYYFFRPLEPTLMSNTGKNANWTQHGTLGRGLEKTTLLTIMAKVYAPQISASKAWPESAKSELMSNFNKVMASLTEIVSSAHGQTVFYLPKHIDLELKKVNQARSMRKELLQDLESIIIQWTRQIKKAVNFRDDSYQADARVGPLEEIEFWRSRTKDLHGISEQLRRSDVMRVLVALESAKSSYLARFQALVKNIHESELEARDNSKFLLYFAASCELLHKSIPADIVVILPELLAKIRIVWTLSGHYNRVNPDRLASLLRKISNEIILRCSLKISLSDIFNGKFETSIMVLEQSIRCGVFWKRLYSKTAAAIALAHSSELHWSFDEASIFAHVDAFVQRCRDLMEICESQIQFCYQVPLRDRANCDILHRIQSERDKSNNEAKGHSDSRVPRFGGSLRGHEIHQALVDIQRQFDTYIDKLRKLEYNVFDVKSSKWHEDFNIFKHAVKDLEVVYANILNAAFDGVTRIFEAVALLDIFYDLAKRDAVIHCVEKKTIDAYTLFIRMVENVRHDFDEKRREPPLLPNEPRFAGSALWANSLASVVHDAWVLLYRALSYHAKVHEADDAEAIYLQLIAVLNDYTASRYKEWLQSLRACSPTGGDGNPLLSRLEIPLMRRRVPQPITLQSTEQMTLMNGSSCGSFIECNFPQELQCMFVEIQYWEKFHGDYLIPYVAHDVCNQHEKLRVMREHVLMVVRAYNAILCELSLEERRLFSEHIRRLDKRVNQGIGGKLNWASRGVVENYVRDCCSHCAQVHAVVRRFKESKRRISAACRQVATMMLIRLDKNEVYDEGVFESKQALHRHSIKRRFEELHSIIRGELVKYVYMEIIRESSSSEVQREWRDLVKKVDHNLELALRRAIKRSLQELSRAINGDAKSEPQILFGVRIVLEAGRVDYRPTMINLTHVVNIVVKEILSTVAVVTRLVEVLSECGGDPVSTGKYPSFYSLISNEEEMLKSVVQIMNGMSVTATELQKYLGNWEKYKFIWEVDKDAYIRRYAKAKRSLNSFHDDVMKYRDQQQEVQIRESGHLIKFVRLDCSFLKAALVSHCQMWQQKLLSLLNHSGRQQLDTLHNAFEHMTTELTTKPKTLAHYLSNIEVLHITKSSSVSSNKEDDALSNEEIQLAEILLANEKHLDNVETRIPQIEKIYAMLAKFEVDITSQEATCLQNLRPAWSQFKEMLRNSELLLDTCKSEMRRDLENALEACNTKVHALREEIEIALPMSGDLIAHEARAVIVEYNDRVAYLQSRYSDLEAGICLFSMSTSKHSGLREAKHVLDLSELIWALWTEWTTIHDAWKSLNFADLDMSVLTATIGILHQRLNKLGHEIKCWGIWDKTKHELTDFMMALPVLKDLRNPALRKRHWNQLRAELGGQLFDTQTSAFTLEAVLTSGLITTIPELVTELSCKANREVAIEQTLAAIEERWAFVHLEIVLYKGQYHKIKSSDDLFELLENDIVAISAMKTCTFYDAFKPRIDAWSTKLLLISEVIEVLLTVQRKWLYFESVFNASEEILKQLPKEAALFQSIHQSFTQFLAYAYEHPNASELCTASAMLLTSQMHNEFESIEKNLKQYLESKRAIFPRFYFVSNVDLLDILGISCTPALLNRHLKKVFEGFKFMMLVESSCQLHGIYECVAMKDTSCGEAVPLHRSVLLDGTVETWLCDLELAMYVTIQKQLAVSIQMLKGSKDKDRTKWVHETMGQLLITTGKIQWTSDCVRALSKFSLGQKQVMRQCKKKQVAYIARLLEILRGSVSRIDRKKLIALITMELHNRDVIEQLIKANCSSLDDFQWLSQLRFTFSKDEGSYGYCRAYQISATIEYGYEFQGNNGRLVVTPLTDRCILTLLTAKTLHRPGNLVGPAGTGKTETVKDLGKNLGIFVVVHNCFSEEHQLLTSEGFKFLDDCFGKQRDKIKFASYDANAGELVYEYPQHLVVNEVVNGEMIEFTDSQNVFQWVSGTETSKSVFAAIPNTYESNARNELKISQTTHWVNGISIVTTTDHEMFTSMYQSQVLGIASKSCGPSSRRSNYRSEIESLNSICDFRKIKARELLPEQNASQLIGFQTCASAGLRPSFESEVRHSNKNVFDFLDIRTRSAQLAFLEFYGYWLNDALLNFDCKNQVQSIIVRGNCTDAGHLDALMKRIGKSYTVTDVDEDQMSTVIVESESWRHLFFEEYSSRCKTDFWRTYESRIGALDDFDGSPYEHESSIAQFDSIHGIRCAFMTARKASWIQFETYMTTLNSGSSCDRHQKATSFSLFNHSNYTGFGTWCVAIDPFATLFLTEMLGKQAADRLMKLIKREPPNFAVDIERIIDSILTSASTQLQAYRVSMTMCIAVIYRNYRAIENTEVSARTLNELFSIVLLPSVLPEARPTFCLPSHSDEVFPGDQKKQSHGANYYKDLLLESQASTLKHQNEKWLFRWALKLDKEMSQAIIAGLQYFGVKGKTETELTPFSSRFRDDFIQLCLHAGYCANFQLFQTITQNYHPYSGSPISLSTRHGTSTITHWEKVTKSEPVLLVASSDIRKRTYTGRTWCVSMPHDYVVVRRAVRDASTQLLKTSIPTIQGNCSDSMDYTSCGHIFSGLCQSGAWGCFDEFNRIPIDVLSVIAMQVLSVVDALSRHSPLFNFMGSEIKCNRQFAIFFTINPGHAGRTELPDNFKTLVRPVAMMIPDLLLIAESTLYAEGFIEARTLAKKAITLYSLMEQQLSKQKFYDYGLRNIKSVLKMSSSLKLVDSTEELSEEMMLLRALRAINLPKLTKDDVRLFELLLKDFFPSVELSVTENVQLNTAIRAELFANRLKLNSVLMHKIRQLHDSKQMRHCNMLVGRPLAGKSTAWKTLIGVQTRLAAQGLESSMPVHSHVINAMAVTVSELYGTYDLQTFDWRDGIVSTIFKKCAETEKHCEMWLVFDGPISTAWLESMNTAMDDNKILTIINGDRIRLSAMMFLLFEVEDLRMASPAIISRAGMIYIDEADIGYAPYVESWLDRCFGQISNIQVCNARELHSSLFEKYVPPMLLAKSKLRMAESVPITDFNAVQSLTRLYEALHTKENGLEGAGDSYSSIAEKWWVFCVVWSIACSVNSDGRKELDIVLREVESLFPANQTIYDFFVDSRKDAFELWQSKLTVWRPRKDDDFFQMLVPTIDTLRQAFIFNAVVEAKHHLLVIGDSGIGKTLAIETMLKEQFARFPERTSSLTINFSATLGSSTLQNAIEASMEKRSKGKLGPSGGRQAIIFCDDFNMPKKASSISPFQPPLELLKHFIDYGGWYDRKRCTWLHILNTQLVAAMAPPSGGRSEICARIQARFHLFAAAEPSDSQLVRIFESILTPKLQEFDNEIKPMGRSLALATVAVYREVMKRFLPTPGRSLYQFSLRDASRVVQGIFQSERHNFDSAYSMLRLWIHECARVFSDRLFKNSPDELADFFVIVRTIMDNHFDDAEWSTVMADVHDISYGPIMCAFLNDQESTGMASSRKKQDAYASDRVRSIRYEEVIDFSRLTRRCEEALEDYNLEPKLLRMKLVFFKDAVRQICRIHRVLVTPRGNLMLVGVHGSGRKSLTRLAAYIAGIEVFTAEGMKHYTLNEWHEGMKHLLEKTGIENISTTFLFSETELEDDILWDDINSVLTSGSIPNLYKKDDFSSLYDKIRRRAMMAGIEDKERELWKYFVKSVQTNLHVVACISPVGATLQKRCRYFPGLLSHCAIDCFCQWSADALKAVGNSFLKSIDFTSQLRVTSMSVTGSMQRSTRSTQDLPTEVDSAWLRNALTNSLIDIYFCAKSNSDKMLIEMQRQNYIAPTHFFESALTFISLFTVKSKEIIHLKGKFAVGLAKLVEARQGAKIMRKILEEKNTTCALSQKTCESLLVKLVSEQRLSDEKRKQLKVESDCKNKEELQYKLMAADAEAGLGLVIPRLQEALKELERLDESALSEIKAYKVPPESVKTVLEAVMILLKESTDWDSAMRVISEGAFLTSIKAFDKDNVTGAVMRKVKRYVSIVEFSPAAIGAVSSAAGALCSWVHAIYDYSNVTKEVEIKRKNIRITQEALAQKKESLKKLEDELAVLTTSIQALKIHYDASVAEKNQLSTEADQIKVQLQRAENLVSGFVGENDRWKESIKRFDVELSTCVGDALVAAAFLTYAGPFDTRNRGCLFQQWSATAREYSIPIQENSSFKQCCSSLIEERKWRLAGLPCDNFSAENAQIATRSVRFPLCIDPQDQAKRWISASYGKSLVITYPADPNFLKAVERSVTSGLPVLVQNVGELIDPALESVLGHSTLTKENRHLITFDEKELEWSMHFKLILTSSLAAPKFPPEMYTKMNIINFTLVQEDLEAQLLRTIVTFEAPNLEKQYSEVNLQVAVGKQRSIDLDDDILRILSESRARLLDSSEVIDALQDCKSNSEQLAYQVQAAEDTMETFDTKREEFRPAAERSSILFFALTDMCRVDTVYTCNLDVYIDLLSRSLKYSRALNVSASSTQQEKGPHSLLSHKMSTNGMVRSKQINAYHTLAVYRYTCSGLFERHKLLFSLQLTLRILASECKLSQSEFEFVCIGRNREQSTLDIDSIRSQRKNPCSDWLEERIWDNILVLDAISSVLSGLASSFEQARLEWRVWFYSSAPEKTKLPGEWDNRLSELQRLCVVRALRFDRLLFAVERFVKLSLGQEFVEPPSYNLSALYHTSTAKTPLILILSPGIDPTHEVVKLAHSHAQRVDICALGQGQSAVAMNSLKKNLKSGSWTLLANCFPSSDHQLLTSRGWMFYEDLQEYSGTDLMFAGYDPYEEQIVYEKALCIRVTGHRTHRMIAFNTDMENLSCRAILYTNVSCAKDIIVETPNKDMLTKKLSACEVQENGGFQSHDTSRCSVLTADNKRSKQYCMKKAPEEASHFSIVATENHDMYCDVGATSNNTFDFGKIKANEILKNVALDFVRFVTCTDDGIGLCIDPGLRLISEAQIEAFLNIYGFWLGKGNIEITSFSIQLFRLEQANVNFLRTCLAEFPEVEWNLCRVIASKSYTIYITQAQWVFWYLSHYNDKHARIEKFLPISLNLPCDPKQKRRTKSNLIQEDCLPSRPASLELSVVRNTFASDVSTAKIAKCFYAPGELFREQPGVRNLKGQYEQDLKEDLSLTQLSFPHTEHNGFFVSPHMDKTRSCIARAKMMSAMPIITALTAPIMSSGIGMVAVGKWLDSDKSSCEKYLADSFQWLSWSWLFRLSKKLLRHIVKGLHRANGVPGMNIINSLNIYSINQVMRLFFHAGYSTYVVARNHVTGKSGSLPPRNLSEDIMLILVFREIMEIPGTNLKKNQSCMVGKSTLAKSKNEIRKMLFTGRCWCAEMPSGFVIVRRITRRNKIIMKSSQPTIQGNCHQKISWLPELERFIEDNCVHPMNNESAPHIDFRLWLTTSPTTQFPITLLQRGIKMIMEPPRGLRANMLQVYDTIKEDQFNHFDSKTSYRRLLFALAWFHSILLERRKFNHTGFNVSYDFNISDFSICNELLLNLLNDCSERLTFKALRYYIAEVAYGGRVTDILDRRLLNVYTSQYFREEIVDVESHYNLAPQIISDKPYVVPPYTDLESVRDIIRALPQHDVPAAFGQHMNAELSLHTDESNMFLVSLMSMHPATLTPLCVPGERVENTDCINEKAERVLQACRNMKTDVPQIINTKKIRGDFVSRSDPDCLKTVLFQELDRYERLLTTVHDSLSRLELSLLGLSVLTPELEDLHTAILHSKVPDIWASCYPSLKPLLSWVKDLCRRIEAMCMWAEASMPVCFWLPSFTYPTGFLTGLLQASAHRNGIPIDFLCWDFPIVNVRPEAISAYPRDGAYVHGLFLEGARFDPDHAYLTEPLVMELVVPFCVLHLRPIDISRHNPKGGYACPLYMYPVRTGTRERPSFVIFVDLGAGAYSPEHWTTRGTALLLSTRE